MEFSSHFPLKRCNVGRIEIYVSAAMNVDKIEAVFSIVVQRSYRCVTLLKTTAREEILIDIRLLVAPLVSARETRT